MGKLNKTDREWQRELSPDEFRITRQKGTEPAFTGKYWNTKQAGTYVCRCCGTPLFNSENKYDSGCGWPSFYDAKEGAVEFTRDDSHGMTRDELKKACKPFGSMRDIDRITKRRAAKKNAVAVQ